MAVRYRLSCRASYRNLNPLTGIRRGRLLCSAAFSVDALFIIDTRNNVPVRRPGSKATFHDSSSEAAFQLVAALSDGGCHVLLFVITFAAL